MKRQGDQTSAEKSRLCPTPWLWAALLFTLIVMLPNMNNGWVNWDDGEYVLKNSLIRSLTFEDIRAIFELPQFMGNYHPLTLLSLSLDYAIGGLHPRVYHVTNVLWHLANVALVFWLIYLLCGRAEVAGLTALLFGIHPMHLESVAWVSARKDLLYGFFFLLSLLSYLYFLKWAGVVRRIFYAMCLFFFLLSLLCKGMAVTLPAVLLALDYLKKRQGWGRLLLEKLPFWALSLAFAILAVIAQQQSTALEGVRDINFSESVFVASYGTIIYIIKAVIPFHLSAFHPYPTASGQLLPWYYYAAALPVLLLAYLYFRYRYRNRIVVFGSLIFIISLAPVLQLLPVGSAVIAERYTYLAYIGIFLVLALGLVHLMRVMTRMGVRHIGIVYLASAVWVLLLATVTWQRSAVWENGESLWTDVINKYPSDYFAYGCRASYHIEQGDFDQALTDYDTSIRFNPEFYEAFNDRGLIYRDRQQYQSALADFTRALELNQNYARGYGNRGLVYLNTNRNEKAMSDFNQAIALDPEFAINYYNRGLLRQRMEQLRPALADFDRAIELDSNQAKFYKDRGFTYGLLSHYGKALADFSQAIALDPNYGEAYFWRSAGYRDLRQYDPALEDVLKARELGYTVTDEYIESLRR